MTSVDLLIVVLWVGLALTLLRPIYRISQRDPTTGLGLLVALGWSGLWFGWLHSLRLPLALLNPIQEGLTGQSVAHLFAEGAHVGRGFTSALRVYCWLVDVTQPSLRAVVGMNCWLAGLNGVLFFLVARHTLRSALGAGLFLVAYVISPVHILATTSAGAGQLLSFLFLLSVTLAHEFDADASARARRVAFIGLLCAGLLAATIRLEMAVLLALGGLTAFINIGLSAHQRKRLLTAWQRVTARAKGWYAHRATTRVKATLAVVGLCLFGVGPLWVESYWLTAVWPTPIALLYFPVFFGKASSGALMILSLLGTAYAFNHIRRFLLLPIGVALLFNLYFVASHHGSSSELLRYGTLICGPLFFLALLGWPQLRALSVRHRWPAGWSLVAWGRWRCLTCRR